VVLGALMAAVQYALVLTPLLPLAVLCAGMVGLLGGIAWGKLSAIRRNKHVQTPPEVEAPQPALKPKILAASMSSYALLALFLGIISLSPTLRSSLNRLTLQMQFPAVTTTTGFSTPEALGQALRPLTHPGTLILLVALLSYLVYRLLAYNQRGSWKLALVATWRSGAPVSVGVISMVGLSTLMEHTGMTPMLALGLSRALGAVFPLVSPLVGVLGAFATGSNNNSNVLFGPLQASVSSLLGIDPRILLAAQTTGGALGSMIAPAKIIVGCSTVGLKGRDGEVLRRTLLYNLGICLLLGLVALLFTL
jgi:lactate permease